VARDPLAAEDRRAPRPGGAARGLVIGSVVLVAVLAFVGLGIERIPSGQVAVPAGSGDAGLRVWEPGWHWQTPWAAPPLRLPREPVALDSELELATAEGAALHFAVSGRFAVRPGGEEAWLAAAGRRPFLDGLAAVVSEALAATVRTIDPAEVFAAGAEVRLTALAAEALAAAGVDGEGLAVTAPVDRNPVAAAVVRNRVARLARPSGRKVLVVGWDGADWLMIRPLLAEGRLPNLAKLVAGGASGELRAEPPLLSPLLWTTIATGKPVTEHGIADFLVRDPDGGQLVPISSTYRKVHALWSLLPAFDLTTDVVAWWATWPAEPVRGTMVTDRVAYQLFDYGESGEAAGKVHPSTAWEAVSGQLVTAEDVDWEQVRRFVDVDRADFERRWRSLPAERRQEDPVNHLRKILATTQSYHSIALSLLERQADLTMVYYEGTDTVGHLFARYLPPRLPGVEAADVGRFGGALPAFYDYADELLGELLAAADDDTVVMLISDHGFFTGEARPASDPSDFAAGAPQWHRLYGVLAAGGRGIGRAEIAGATIFDVAPTVLALLGVPVPEDLPGRVLEALLPPEVRRGREEIGPLASYEILPRSRPREVRTASADDAERLRELVALGYISPAALEARGNAPSGDRPTASSARPADLESVSTEAYNLGRIHHREGRLEEAKAQYRIAIERLPSFGHAYASLAQVASGEGDHSAAFDWLVAGFSKSRTMPQSALTGLVDEAAPAGRLADAERVLLRLGDSHGGQSAYHAALGLLREKQGRTEVALAHYDRALAIDPLDQLSVEQKVTLLRRLGREPEARAFFVTTRGRAEGSVAAMNQLAVIALRQGWPGEAEPLLRRVLESDPGNAGLMANLAATMAQQGRMGEAAEMMRQALARDPANARNHFNLGAMLAEQGRTAEALAAFEQAVAHGLRSPRVHVAAAKMRFRLGDRPAAEAELERALAIDPADGEARQLLAVLRQGG
jgi:predicted AlkP superfamily phosphohydrolase/phosphomutase/Tfp pilus assembly protein PilF